MRQYIALIHKEANSDYGVSFPDLPGVVSAGSTLDEARDMAAEALALHLEGMAEDGETAPEPSSLEEIMKDAQNRDGVAVLVATPTTDVKSVRINVTMPADVLDQIDRYAEREGFTAFWLPCPSCEEGDGRLAGRTTVIVWIARKKAPAKPGPSMFRNMSADQRE